MSERIEVQQMLARSAAGHDKDRVYAVVGEDSDCLYLSDGVHKLIASPKKKKRKHLKLIIHLPDDIKDLLKNARNDSDLVYAIRRYERAAFN